MFVFQLKQEGPAKTLAEAQARLDKWLNQGPLHPKSKEPMLDRILPLNNEDSRKARAQIDVFQAAMEKRKTEPNPDFSKLMPNASPQVVAYFDAAWKELGRLHPPPFAALPSKTKILFTEKSLERIDKDTTKILGRRTITVLPAGGEKYTLTFSRDLDPQEMSRVKAELRNWAGGSYDLSLALARAKVGEPEISRVLPNGNKVRVDLSSEFLIGKSNIQGTEAKDYIYNKSGLSRDAIYALEQAWSRRAENPIYKPGFENIDPKERALARAAFGEVAIYGGPKGYQIGGAELAKLEDRLDAVRFLGKDVTESDRDREYAKYYTEITFKSGAGKYVLSIPVRLPESQRLALEDGLRSGKHDIYTMLVPFELHSNSTVIRIGDPEKKNLLEEKRMLALQRGGITDIDVKVHRKPSA